METVKSVYVRRLRRAWRNGCLTPEQIARCKALGLTPSSSNTPRAVVCVESGEEYATATAAVKALGLKSSTAVINAIRSGGTAGGYHWYYADQPKPEIEQLKLRQSKPVRCIETGEVFQSLSEAARFCERSNPTLRKAIAKRWRCGGYHFDFLDSIALEGDAL